MKNSRMAFKMMDGGHNNLDFIITLSNPATFLHNVKNVPKPILLKERRNCCGNKFVGTWEEVAEIVNISQHFPNRIPPTFRECSDSQDSGHAAV